MLPLIGVLANKVIGRIDIISEATLTELLFDRGRQRSATNQRRDERKRIRVLLELQAHEPVVELVVVLEERPVRLAEQPARLVHLEDDLDVVAQSGHLVLHEACVVRDLEEVVDELLIGAEATVAQLGQLLAVSVEANLEQAEAEAHHEQQIADYGHQRVSHNDQCVQFADRVVDVAQPNEARFEHV